MYDIETTQRPPENLNHNFVDIHWLLFSLPGTNVWTDLSIWWYDEPNDLLIKFCKRDMFLEKGELHYDIYT